MHQNQLSTSRVHNQHLTIDYKQLLDILCKKSIKTAQQDVGSICPSICLTFTGCVNGYCNGATFKHHHPTD